MNWSEYKYLAIVAPLALLLVVALLRLTPKLCTSSRKRTGIEILSLVLSVSVGLAVIYGNFYRETFSFAYVDIGSDTIEQYIPFYLNLIDRVRNGALSLWNWEYELGSSIATYQSWILDPFNVVVVGICLLIGDAHLSLALVLSQSLKVLLSALLFDHLLTRYCDTPLSRILGSILFAFNGFLLQFGQHYWLGSAFPIFTATALLFELYLEKPCARTFLTTTLICMLQLAWSPYIAFMILVFEAIYLLLRIPHYVDGVNLGRYLQTVCLLFLPVIAGVLLAGFTLVPYASYLMGESSRTQSDATLIGKIAASFKSMVNPDWVPAIFSRLLGSSLLTTGADGAAQVVPSFKPVFFYEFMLLGYSGGVLLLLSQFYAWVFEEGRLGEKVLVGIASILVIMYCFNKFLPSLFTMFVYLYYRSSFVLAVPLCCAAALGFEKRVMSGKVARIPLAIASVFTIGILVWSLLNTVNGRLVCLYYLAATCIVIMMLYLQEGEKARPAYLVVAIAMAFSMSVVDGFFGTNCRGRVLPDYFPRSSLYAQDATTREALNLIAQDDSTGDFYRVDKTYPLWSTLNDSMIGHYASVSAYNSSPDGDVERFYQQLWEQAIPPWGACVQGYRFDQDCPDMMSLLGMRYVIANEPLTYEWLTPLGQVGPAEGTLYVYRYDDATSIVTFRTSVVAESVADALPDAAARRNLIKDSIIVSDVAAQNLGTYTAVDDGTQLGVASLRMQGDAMLTGTIEAKSDCVACISIPHTEKWTIQIDGAPVETFRANYGFYGFVLPGGSHEIVARYAPSGLGAGLCASGIGALVCILVSIMFVRHTDTSKLGTVLPSSKHATTMV